VADIPIPNPSLDVRDLRVVLALAAAGTTARAASVLHLTQPAVSRALLSVEEKLEARLFDRSSRGLSLTAAGRCVVAGAERLLVELADLELRARSPAARPVRIRLVCECHTAYHWLPSALVRLRESLPGIEIAIAIEHTHAPVAGLERGEVDIALLTASPSVRGPLAERALFADEVVFVVAASHALAKKAAVTRADLRNHTILGGDAPPAETAWFMKEVFGRSRPRLDFQRLPLTEAVLDMARAGMGIAVLSEWVAGPHLGKGDLVGKRLSSGAIRRPWRLAFRREATDAALRLLPALEATVPRARLTG
jgi:LysR family transcriptional regulator for metE and metH